MEDLDLEGEIETVLERLEGSGQKSRREALQELPSILTETRKSNYLKRIEDSHYRDIFATIFKVVVSEKKNLAKSSKTQRDSAAKLLSECALAVRLTTEICLRYFGRKTVSLIIDHITKELPEGGLRFCEPLTNGYMRALRTILEFQAHADHIAEDRWSLAVQFCVETIRTYVDTPTDESNDSTPLASFRSGGSRAPTPSISRSMTPGRIAVAPTESNALSLNNKQLAEHGAACLSHLLAIPHGPVLEVFFEYVDTTLEYLGSTFPGPSPHGQEFTFRCLNVVLNLALTENVALAEHIIKEAIPLIRRFWTPKSHSSLKDEMLVLLIIGEPILRRLSKDSAINVEALGLLSLVTTLQSEYINRNDKEVLLESDLEFEQTANLPARYPLAYPMLKLKLGSSRAEQSWALLRSVGVLFALSKGPGNQETTFHTAEDDVEGRRSKRPKVEDPLNAILDSMLTSSGSERVAYLQSLMFIVAESRLEPTALQPLLDKILPLLSSQSTEVSNWAMITLSCAALSSNKQTTSSHWNQVWDVTSRKVINVASSRSACLLLNTLLCSGQVTFAGVKESIETMISDAELHAPATPSDSSLSLFTTILQFKAKANPSSIPEASDSIIRWFLLRWQPSKLPQRHADLRATNLPKPEHVLRLLGTSLGTKWQNFGVNYTTGGKRIAVMSSQVTQNQDLISYLLLNDHDDLPVTAFASDNHERAAAVDLAESRFKRLFGLVIDSISAEIDYVLGDEEVSSAYSKLIANPVAIALLTTLDICAFVISLSGPPNNLKSRGLRAKAEQLRHYLQTQLLALERPDEAAVGLQWSLGPLLACVVLEQKHCDFSVHYGAHLTAHSFGSEVWLQIRSIQGNDHIDKDIMDVDGDIDSQRSQTAKHSVMQTLRTNHAQSHWSLSSSEATYLMRIILASDRAMQIEDNTEVLLSSTISENFVQFITLETLGVSNAPFEDQPSYEFLACRAFFNELLQSKINVSDDCIVHLLRYIGQELLSTYAFERNEVALSICLEVLTASVKSWQTDENDTYEVPIHEVASQLYEWQIGTTLTKHNLSPHVHICMSELLLALIQEKPDYGRGTDLPSPRNSLFTILSRGMVQVKYSLGLKLSNIFGLFVLMAHEAILDNIARHLPMVQDWAEGTALRIFILSHLASSWSTLTRRCLYAMVEAPSLVPSSSDHAKYCVSRLAEKLSLSSPKALFKLFSSQILYTWLGSQSLSSLPFGIFQYQSLKELIFDVKTEVTAQVLMRGRESEAQELSDLLQQQFKSLLQEAFGKSAAYVIAHDAAVSPTVDKQAAHGAKRLRMTFGKDQYNQLIASHFPEILATLFKTSEREELITKGFQKDKHVAARTAYDKILSSGASESNLVTSQQPSFKAAYLVDEIEYICAKANIQLGDIWTPSLYVYVFRGLMRTVHPALGSLHNVTVVRRMRILISMAGDHALRDYPLEMSLHALRPFLTDAQCAEDSMGIFKYMVFKGSEYLEQNISFFSGIVLTALVSLKAFLNTPQESTTQESEYRRTMTKAEELRDWLGSFAMNANFATDDLDLVKRFKNLITPARLLTGGGNANKTTGESELLLALLSDQTSSIPLVDAPLRNIVIETLSKDFSVPLYSQDDILGTDLQAARYASPLWVSYHKKGLSEAFGLWVARVLGRAYAGSGFVAPAIVRESPEKQTVPKSISSSRYLTAESMFSILRSLCEILLSGNIWEAGIVERTLQSIVSYAANDETLAECIAELPQSLLPAFTWTNPVVLSPIPEVTVKSKLTEELVANEDGQDLDTWVRNLCLALIENAPEGTMVSELMIVVDQVNGVATTMISFLVHLVLLYEHGRKQTIRSHISKGIKAMFGNVEKAGIQQVKLMISVILYLRSQCVPSESTISDRFRWLDLDYQLAADAATKCGMFKTALMFIETTTSENMKVKTSRRSTGISTELPPELLMSIFRNLDDKDLYYGIQQPSSLSTLMNQLEFENAGFKSLSLRGALYDSQIRSSGSADAESAEGIIKLLSNLDQNGLSLSMCSGLTSNTSTSLDAMFETARKLEKWDVAAPMTPNSQATIIFKTYQEIYDAPTHQILRETLDISFNRALELLATDSATEVAVHANLGTLAMLTEIEDLLTSDGSDKLREVWDVMAKRDDWMRNESFEKSAPIISSRRTLTSTLSKSPQLQGLLRVIPRDGRILEAKALLNSSVLGRHHGSIQSSLDAATYLSTLVEPCRDLGINIDAASQLEASNVLWDSSEMAASIGMVRDITQTADLRSQALPVGRPELLAKLGHRVSEARLEKSDEIIENYLVPAKKELNRNAKAAEAVQVFHEFASFCDRQLQNSDDLEDLRRISSLRERKYQEVQDLEKLIKSGNSQTKERDQLKSHRNKAKQWYDIDNAEYQRLIKSRQALLNQSLENYLLALQAGDAYDNDSLRFSALWLKHSDNDEANAAVAKYISQVPSRKFAALMNQWTSRLLESQSQFQRILSDLVLRICREHPFHGMFHIFASSKTKGGQDQTALSRNAAANFIASQLKNDKKTQDLWIAIHNTNITYVMFAGEKSEDGSYKQGAKIPLRKSAHGKKLEQNRAMQHVPPPTMKIDLRADGDYTEVPKIARFQSEFSIASGISMPKILTAIGTDGKKYKQLFKSGNDDLRQDAIMEQVFEQVSNLLGSQRDTRQRKLGIRTYRVLPLTATAGVIEFVSNTLPLNDFLIPAHPRHFPDDHKPSHCRKLIHQAQAKGTEQRIITYRSVCDKFHPVLRYFFMERFEGPDEWFASRLAYTRSTAAISILGHILGLGDRHGHNILLDEKTGEVVHIDLGIAFEQGRVLPVPELVPFRLTRDLVDGMGITGTEGVFRRCCEFTLDALRNESYSIMTILDVLRYDPLYSWSVSPLRLKKLQDDQTDAAGLVGAQKVDASGVGVPNAGDKKDEEGEAERALTVVSKKLSKALSVTATVNELIQQATDEKNLALLFCGWAAYA